MRNFVFILMCVLTINEANAQVKEGYDKLAGQPDPKGVYTTVDQKPQFEGGEDAMMTFLAKQIRYPAFERDNDISGRVLIRFVVNEDGSLSDITLISSASEGLDKEAQRVVKLFPKFSPGLIAGKPVKVYYTMPVRFRLQ